MRKFYKTDTEESQKELTREEVTFSPNDSYVSLETVMKERPKLEGKSAADEGRTGEVGIREPRLCIKVAPSPSNPTILRSNESCPSAPSAITPELKAPLLPLHQTHVQQQQYSDASAGDQDAWALGDDATCCVGGESVRTVSSDAEGKTHFSTTATVNATAVVLVVFIVTVLVAAEVYRA